MGGEAWERILREGGGVPVIAEALFNVINLNRPAESLMGDAEFLAAVNEIMQRPPTTCGRPRPAARRIHRPRSRTIALCTTASSKLKNYPNYTRHPMATSTWPAAARVTLAPRANQPSINLTVHESGEGPAVVFCHGFPELAYSWRHQLPAVAAAGFRAIAPDQRGYADSSAPAAVD